MTVFSVSYCYFISIFGNKKIITQTIDVFVDYSLLAILEVMGIIKFKCIISLEFAIIKKNEIIHLN